MKRDIDSKLVDWSRSSLRMPLLITGVRQCGKTHAMKELGETEFGGDYAYFNFELEEDVRRIFENDLKPQRIVEELGVASGKAIVPGKTLLIFDEIQSCKRAITALKYFQEMMPEQHVVCAGSLLGVMLDHDFEQISFPVGKVERAQMYPMSFKEFFEAVNPNLFNLFEYRYNHGAPIPDTMKASLETTLRMYWIIGGMPKAVSTWIDTKDIAKVEAMQDKILMDYENDFTKHASKDDVPHLHIVWNAIPGQLGKKNSKFVFSREKEAKSAWALERAVSWLSAAGLVHKLHMVDTPILPLSSRASSRDFVLYMADIGLLRKKANISPRSILLNNEAFNPFKRMFNESFVMQELIALGKEPYNWAPKNNKEVDFIFQEVDDIVPVEAKAGEKTSAESFELFTKKTQPKYGFKVSMKNVGDHVVNGTRVYSVPLYLMWKLNDWIAIEKAKEPPFDMGEIYDDLLVVDEVLEEANKSVENSELGCNIGPVKSDGPELD